MIKLSSETINQETLNHLESIQNGILKEIGLENQVLMANSKWNNKTSGLNKVHFEHIKDLLIKMCVGVEICVYCENNEATDIEHFYPKKLYPEKTFDWENYLLSCSKCNRDYKKDKFKIFNPINSNNEEDVTCPKNIYIKPSNKDSLLINPRFENPLDYLEYK